MKKVILSLALVLTLASGFSSSSFSQGKWEVFKITAYDNCKLCCGKDITNPAYGITASGLKAKAGYCAVNWLNFGTDLEIEGLGTYKVMDRGAVSLFGSKENKIKHIDIWMSSHSEAKKFGIKYLKVNLKGGSK